eukprot:755806-Hanusia_phi.AAC.3
MVEIAIGMQESSRKLETEGGWKALENELMAGKLQEQPRLFCKALEHVLDRVNAMRLDAANARLRTIAHVIQHHGIEYEQAHMLKKIKANPGFLQQTPQWIREAVEHEVDQGRATLSQLVQGDGVAYARIHAAAVLKLIVARDPVKAETCPETLRLDLARLQKYHTNFHLDALAACMLAMASQRLIARRRDPEVLGLLERLKTWANSFDASLVPAEETKAAAASLEAELSAQDKKLIAACLSPSQPAAFSSAMLEQLLEVPALVLQKSYGPIEDRWRGLVSEDGNMLESDVPQSPFVRNVYERIVRNARQVRKVISLNRKVHYERYNQMILAQSWQVLERKGPGNLRGYAEQSKMVAADQI